MTTILLNFVLNDPDARDALTAAMTADGWTETGSGLDLITGWLDIDFERTLRDPFTQNELSDYLDTLEGQGICGLIGVEQWLDYQGEPTKLC